MTNRFPAAINRRLPPPTGGFSNEWHQRGVNWSATIVFRRKEYRLLQERPAGVLRISEGDAILKVFAPHDIGETFYIQMEVEERPLLPCWAIRKSPSAIYAHFHVRLNC